MSTWALRTGDIGRDALPGRDQAEGCKNRNHITSSISVSDLLAVRHHRRSMVIICVALSIGTRLIVRFVGCHLQGRGCPPCSTGPRASWTPCRRRCSGSCSRGRPPPDPPAPPESQNIPAFRWRARDTHARAHASIRHSPNVQTSSCAAHLGNPPPELLPPTSAVRLSALQRRSLGRLHQAAACEA